MRHLLGIRVAVASGLALTLALQFLLFSHFPQLLAIPCAISFPRALLPTTLYPAPLLCHPRLLFWAAMSQFGKPCISSGFASPFLCLPDVDDLHLFPIVALFGQESVAERAPRLQCRAIIPLLSFATLQIWCSSMAAGRISG